MKNPRIVVLVSSDKSDLYFANQLIQRFNILSVVIEHQQDTSPSTPKIKKIIWLLFRPHQLIKKIISKIKTTYETKYALYNRPENQLNFGKEGGSITPKESLSIITVHGKNSINNKDIVTHIKDIKPDIIAVCGTSILSEDILAIPTVGALNLHGGLSQFYRGLWTTDWAVYNEELECIGATVHFISAGIDDGEILYQGRPTIEKNDNPHTLYVKVVKLGIKMMSQAILDIQNNQHNPVQLKKKGRLYLEHMTTPKRRRQTWAKLSKGVVCNYLANKEHKDKKVLSLLVNTYVDE